MIPALLDQNIDLAEAGEHSREAFVDLLLVAGIAMEEGSLPSAVDRRDFASARFAGSILDAQSATSAPSLARCSAQARPMPRAALVTIATLPLLLMFAP